MFGHLEDVCRKKTASKKVWRRVKKGQNTTTESPITQNNDSDQNEGKEANPIQDPPEFTQVTKKSVARAGKQQSMPQPASPNSFQLLQSITEVPNQVEKAPDKASND